MLIDCREWQETDLAVLQEEAEAIERKLAELEADAGVARDELEEIQAQIEKLEYELDYEPED